MFVRNQIKGALSQPPAIAYVAGLLTAGGEFVNRTELADFLCEEFNFHARRARPDAAPWLPEGAAGTGSGRPLHAPGGAGQARAEYAQAVAGGGAGSNRRARPGG